MFLNCPAVRLLRCRLMPIFGGILWLGFLSHLSAMDTPTRTADSATSTAQTTVDPLQSATPQSIADLRAIEEHVQKVAAQAVACTVGLQVGGAQGSGVIISRDGYILTAAHVIGMPGRPVVCILPDGRRVPGKTLGLNRELDSGMIRITAPGNWPFVPVDETQKWKIGDWCLATGHPGGVVDDRSPVVRLGRVVAVKKNMLQTDCTLVGGDSGGPLFDLKGHLIGIHSRIGAPTNWNFHIPVTTFKREWDALLAGENILDSPKNAGTEKPSPKNTPPADTPLIGINGEDDPRGCRVTAVNTRYPAAKAGLQVGDVITKFNDEACTGFDALKDLIRKKKVGDSVRLELVRGDQIFRIDVVLSGRLPPQ